MENIILENEQFRLTLRPDCVAESLICKANGQECLDNYEEMPLFTLTEPRPFNNEIKLAYPNKRTTYGANRVRMEGDKLIVGFEILGWEAVVSVKITPRYIAFELVDFIYDHDVHFESLSMTPPPVTEFRLIQLPVKHRENFGAWLNVMWDEEVAVNVLAAHPFARIDSEKRKDYRVLTADALSEVQLKNVPAALIVCPKDDLLDAIDSLEEDFDLPRGVKSRRGEKINRSMYWVPNCYPETVDEYIKYAKKMGLTMMTLYYPSLWQSWRNYGKTGDYTYNEHYPNGAADVKVMLDKIKAAGITPGLHVLPTHIGVDSYHVTPKIDHRIRLTRHFTLAKPLSKDDTTVYVEQNPIGCVMDEKCRVLNFEGEGIYYESYTTEPPYCFTGCVRGHYETEIQEHKLGTIGGPLDVSEYCACSLYLDQNSSFMDELAEQIADGYAAGFEYLYLDGAEGANVPYEIYIPLAQYRVYKKCKPLPLFVEGAAKAHFSWHVMSGANAFDYFQMPVFKEKIAEFPCAEAPEIAKDFTRLNFGWWLFNTETMPDMYEYGTSRAAAWDCPTTVMFRGWQMYTDNPRTEDCFEVMRRWEDVRRKNWLTAEQKEMLKDTAQEHTLLINEKGEYELVPYDFVKGAGGEDAPLSVFVFERAGKSYAVIWHTTGEGELSVPFDGDFTYKTEIAGEDVATKKDGGSVILPVGDKRYFSANVPKETLAQAFARAKMM